MRIPRIYVEQGFTAGARIELPAPGAHHVAQVLRLRAGDALHLFDGAGTQGEARIVRIDRKAVAVAVDRCVEVDRESPLRITLAQGISRGERMDYTIQKAVELGVHAIAPVLAERTTVRLDEERAGKRLQHWRQIIVSACEQCGRNRLPDLLPIVPLHEWLARPGDGLQLVLRADATASLSNLAPATDAVILIGPEGGLSEAEVHAAEGAGYRAVRLGPRVLRTETAALAALAALQTLHGDLGS